MDSSCLRCGRCCTSFGVCVTPSDVKRIMKATGKPPEWFLTIVPEPPERERSEPAIMIDGKPSLLVLKWKKKYDCLFYSVKGCIIYENRPMLCRSYPFNCLSSSLSCLERDSLRVVSSRACPVPWQPKEKEKQQYLLDCERYLAGLAEYEKIAEIWNKKGGGSLKEFLFFISDFVR